MLKPFNIVQGVPINMGLRDNFKIIFDFRKLINDKNCIEKGFHYKLYTFQNNNNNNDNCMKMTYHILEISILKVFSAQFFNWNTRV